MTTRLAFLILIFAMTTSHTVCGDDAGNLPFGFIEPKNGKKERLWMSFTKRYEADGSKYLSEGNGALVCPDGENPRVWSVWILDFDGKSVGDNG